MPRLEVKEVARASKGRSRSHCPLCDTSLWLAPGAPDEAVVTVLRAHLGKCPNIEWWLEEEDKNEK